MNRMLFRNAQVPMSPYGVDDTVYKSRVSHHSEQLLSTHTGNHSRPVVLLRFFMVGVLHFSMVNHTRNQPQ